MIVPHRGRVVLPKQREGVGNSLLMLSLVRRQRFEGVMVSSLNSNVVNLPRGAMPIDATHHPRHPQFFRQNAIILLDCISLASRKQQQQQQP
jgi:hypothetical protein